MGQTLSPEPQGPTEPQQHSASSGAPYPPIYPPPPERYQPPHDSAPTVPAGQAEAVSEPPAMPPPPQQGLVAVMEPPAPSVWLPPEEPRKQNTAWRAIKWPLRKLLLGVYVLGEEIRKHKRESLIVGALLVALIATGAAVYQLTRPAPPVVAVEQPNLPTLPASVIHYLHARQHFDATEVWAAYNPTARKSLNTTEAQLQTALNQEKSAGLSIDRFVYTGGYRLPDGTAHYTVEVYSSEQGQSGVFTWYFDVGTDGLIQQRRDMTKQ